MLKNVSERYGHQFLSFTEGHTIKISSHALQRIGERKGEATEKSFKNAALAVVKNLIKKNIGPILKKGDRFAVRSKHENIIVIISADKVISEEEFTLCICTVWNLNDEDFYYRKDLIVLEASLTVEGVIYTFADEDEISRGVKKLNE